MRTALFIAIAILLSSCATTPPRISATQRTVSFQTQDYNSWNDYFADRPSAEPTISGVLAYPPGTGRVPAVVVMSGSTGITAAEQNAARALVKAGFASFLVDQASGRGLSPQTDRYALVGLGVPARLADGMNALRALAAQPRIDPAHIGILGISLGGEDAIGLESTVLQGPYARFDLRYAAHAGLYPVCAFTSDGPGTTTGAPMLLLVGGGDTSAPPAMCHAIVALRQQTDTKSDIHVVEYPDALHAWAEPGIIGTPYVPGKISLQGCPIVSITSPRSFYSYHNGELHRLPNDHAFYAVFHNCWSKGARVGYSAGVTRKSTNAFLAFFKNHLMQ